MIYKFEDLLFNNELVTLEACDVASITKSNDGKQTFFVNVDGLVFAAESDKITTL